MTNNSVKYEALVKQYLPAFLDVASYQSSEFTLNLKFFSCSFQATDFKIANLELKSERSFHYVQHFSQTVLYLGKVTFIQRIMLIYDETSIKGSTPIKRPLASSPRLKNPLGSE